MDGVGKVVSVGADSITATLVRSRSTAKVKRRQKPDRAAKVLKPDS